MELPLLHSRNACRRAQTPAKGANTANLQPPPEQFDIELLVDINCSVKELTRLRWNADGGTATVWRWHRDPASQRSHGWRQYDNCHVVADGQPVNAQTFEARQAKDTRTVRCASAEMSIWRDDQLRVQGLSLPRSARRGVPYP